MIEPDLHDRAPLMGDRVLRQFAGICLAVFGGLSGAESLVWGRPARAVVFGCIALVTGVGGLIDPRVVAPIFRAAMAVATPIGRVTSAVLLAAVFHGVFTPMGAIMRLIGYDGLKRRRRTERSYWAPKERPPDVRSYFRQS